MQQKLYKSQKFKYIAGAILILVTCFAYFIQNRELPFSEESSLLEALVHEEISEEPTMIYVDIAGAVRLPSVIEIEEGSRVYEAIARAGGVLQEADTDGINLAAVLNDGEKIYVPTEEEVSDGHYQNVTKSSGRINLNTASYEELQMLPGIGPATAAAILEYRTQNGKFNTIEEIQNISGIGEKTFLKFQDKICVN